jgi:hypothetical protein
MLYVITNTSIAIVTKSRSGAGATCKTALQAVPIERTRPHTTAIIDKAMRALDG